MRFLLLLATVFIFTSCSDQRTYGRGYVISKTTLDTEQEEMAAEEPEIH